MRLNTPSRLIKWLRRCYVFPESLYENGSCQYALFQPKCGHIYMDFHKQNSMKCYVDFTWFHHQNIHSMNFVHFANPAEPLAF